MHVNDFPISTPAMVVWFLCLTVAVVFFIRLLNYLLRKGRRGWMGGIFGLLLVLGTAVHVVMLSRSSHTVTDGNWIQLVLTSLVAGFEMFVGHTVVFDDIIAAVVFRSPGLLMAYLTVFAFVLAFSVAMVFQILPRRLRDRFWLRIHAPSASADRKNHVFLGLSRSAKLLAKSILKDWAREEDRSDQGSLIFVDLPDTEGVHAEISLGDILTNLVSRRKEVGLDEELETDRFVLLKGHRPVPGRDEDLADAVGLARLRPWLRNPRTSVYLLLDDEEENRLMVRYLFRDPDVQAKVFCRVDRMDGFNSLYTVTQNRLNLVDFHYLSVQDLKFGRPELHPVRFVDVARDGKGQPLGYVDGEFHALLVGFDTTGQEAMRFLYEFGSFVGPDNRRIPTSFNVFGSGLGVAKGDFLNRFPGLRDDPAIIWNGEPVGSDGFWRRCEALMDGLNYVLIAHGSAQQNIELSILLLQLAARRSKDLSRFVILVRVDVEDDRLQDLLGFYNRTYHPGGQPVIRPFGMSEAVWTLPSITGKDLKDQASRFYDASQRSMGGSGDWESRRKELLNEPGDRLRNRMALHRMQGQDLSRSAFIPTMLWLAGERGRKAAEGIPLVYDGVHYPGKGAVADTLEHLAAQEHLRSNGFHLVCGYVSGELDELLRRVPDLKDYDEEDDPRKQHADWVVVRTALAGDNTDHTDE
ncbi:MAG: hypothetical protein IJ156_05490 [Bacteroidales bacterium]|nr:hypothetical protein [Bacteroidales bacterium]